jgi:aryl-alcohol dehydrogenase-like predicted oxidoreductase
MTPQLCLGTAQFGMHYGVTNSNGQVDKAEIQNILRYASSSNIIYIDTAQAYGESELLIGTCKPKDVPFQIVSKLTSQAIDLWTYEHLDTLEKSFQLSLQQLQVFSIDSFLMHSANDFRITNSKLLIDWLSSLQSRNLVKRIGVSIYSADDLQNIPLDLFQIVQLPMSIYDQRLLQDGTIKKISDSGIAIHVRSVFLQGLILETYLKWPLFLTHNFKRHHRISEELAFKNNCSMLDLALGFVQSIKEIEAVLVGVTSLKELMEINTSWTSEKSNLRGFPNSYFKFNWNNSHDLDPRYWPT